MVGFKRKDQSDIVVFLLRAFLVLWNTVALIVVTIMKYAALASPERDILRGSALEVSELLGREAALASALLTLFASGTFVVPYLGFFLTYPGELAKTMFLMRTGFYGSNLTPRQGEKLLEPMEMWLPWDYASHIQLPCCAFFPLFFAEPPGYCAARTLCSVLCGWCAVMYVAQRIIHLRASKKTFFTTERLDTAALYMWACPLSMLLHVSVYWAIRANVMDVTNVTQAAIAFAVTFPANMAGAGLYGICLKRCLRTQTDRLSSSKVLLHRGANAEHQKTYSASLAELRYSYFNTNPVYVLMSELLDKWENSDSNKRLSTTTWYEAGKVYLQAGDPKAEARLEATRTVAELYPAREAAPSHRLFHPMQVWATGEPQHAYQSLNNN